jgi:hypothetical protein
MPPSSGNLIVVADNPSEQFEGIADAVRLIPDA